MTTLTQEETIKTTASATSVGPSPYEVGARFGVFTTDCTVAGVSIAGTVASVGAHIAATSGVHGATGAVVGTTNVQALSGKTIDTATNTVTVTVSVRVRACARPARARAHPSTPAPTKLN